MNFQFFETPGPKLRIGKIFAVNLLVIAAIWLLGEFILRANNVDPNAFLNFAVVEEVPQSHLAKNSNKGVDLKDGEFRLKTGSGLIFEAKHKNGTRTGSPITDDSIATVWLYGCSFFYGFGLPDSHAVGAQLGSILPNYNIRNRAVSGYGNVQMYLKMKEDESHWREGDVVIMTYASFHAERNVMALSYRNKLYTFGQGKLTDVNFPMIEETDGKLHIKHDRFDYPAFPLREQSSVFYGLELLRNRFLDDPKNAETLSHRFMTKIASEFKDKSYRCAFARLSNDQMTQSLFETLAADGHQCIDVSLNFADTAYNLLPLDAHPNESAHAYFAHQIAQWVTEP